MNRSIRSFGLIELNRNLSMRTFLSSTSSCQQIGTAGIVTDIAFIGLGAMGYGMAANLHRSCTPDETVHVWNRTVSIAKDHQQKIGTRAAPSFDHLKSCSIIFLCLPTSAEVESVCSELGPRLSPGTIVADCTSGDPHKTRKIAIQLENQHGVHMVDCPVSGGPAGATSGELTSMVGGAREAVNAIMPYLSRMAKKNIVQVGPVGAGHAVKAVNNTLNSAHLLLAAEGLIALAEFGIAPDVAVEAINGSSGRSLQTEVRVPKEVLTREFNYGFPLGLMHKDVSTAVESVCRGFKGTNKMQGPKFFPIVKDFLERAVDLETKEADYTKVIRPLEAEAGIELHSSRMRSGSTTTSAMHVPEQYNPPPYNPS